MKPKANARFAAILTVCTPLWSCGDDGGASYQTDASSITLVDAGTGSTTTAECDQAPRGTPCGAPASSMHCIFNACVNNACGDGVKAGDEACDDGNQIDHDGCDSHCKVDIPACGNGKLDPAEECDDGNSVNTDLCTNQCTIARCGDAIVGPGEDCDDGNSVDTDSCNNRCNASADAGSDAGRDAGSATSDASTDAGATDSSTTTNDSGSVSGDSGTLSDGGYDSGTANTNDASSAGHDAAADASSPANVDASSSNPNDSGQLGADSGQPASDAGSAPADSGSSSGADAGNGGDACAACRNDVCRNYMGTDLVHGCFEAVVPDYGADASDPTFIQQCTDVVNCAHAHNCAYSDSTQAAGCYCGSYSIDQCSMTGPAPDAPCVPQWQAATRTMVNADIQTRMTDLSYPAGFAYFLLDCERDPSLCGHHCAGAN